MLLGARAAQPRAGGSPSASATRSAGSVPTRSMQRSQPNRRARPGWLQVRGAPSARLANPTLFCSHFGVIVCARTKRNHRLHTHTHRKSHWHRSLFARRLSIRWVSGGMASTRIFGDQLGAWTIYPRAQLHAFELGFKSTRERYRAQHRPPARAFPALRSASRSRALTVYRSQAHRIYVWLDFVAQRRPHRTHAACGSTLQQWRQVADVRRADAAGAAGGHGQPRAARMHRSRSTCMLCDLVKFFVISPMLIMVRGSKT